MTAKRPTYDELLTRVAQLEARRHDGAITVVSTAGKGSKFSLYLPAVRTPLVDSGLVEPSSMHKGAGSVLVMDDDETVRPVATRRIRSWRIRLRTASRPVCASLLPWPICRT